MQSENGLSGGPRGQFKDDPEGTEFAAGEDVDAAPQEELEAPVDGVAPASHDLFAVPLDALGPAPAGEFVVAAEYGIERFVGIDGIDGKSSEFEESVMSRSFGLASSEAPEEGVE